MYYFDNSATTCPTADNLAVFSQVATQYYANPSSIHIKGEESRQLLKQSRQQIAHILNYQEKEIFFAASGTEANNWVLHSIVEALSERHPNRYQIILSAIEHPSIMAQIPMLQSKGFDVKLCNVNQYGELDLTMLSQLLNEHTLLLSTMAVNNEVGTIQPLQRIAQLLENFPHITWHVDAVQAVTTSLDKICLPRIDVLTLSSHKFHAVRGTGILAKRERIPSKPFIYGGGQELGLRSGTENLPSIVVAARALRLMSESQKEVAKIAHFRKQIVAQLSSDGWHIFGGEKTSEHIICTALEGIPGEVLVHALEQENIIVSTTSACSSRKHQTHSTLDAMGISKQISTSAIRISMSTTTTQEEVSHLLNAIHTITQQFKR